MLKGRPSRCRARLTRPSPNNFRMWLLETGFTAQFHLRIDLDLKTHLAPQFCKQLHIALGLVTKMKVVAFVHFASTQLFLQNFFSELAWGHQRKIASEGKQQHRVQPAGLEQTQLFRSGRNQLQPRVRPQNACGMGFESNRHRPGALLSRATHDFLEHMTVSSMHAVKVADAHQRRPKGSGNILEFVEDLHLKRL